MTKTRIVSTGQAVPALGAGFTYGGATGAPVIADNGQVLINFSVSGPGVTLSNDSVLFTGSPGALLVAAREGDATPGTPTANIYLPLSNASPFTQLHLNESGEVGFAVLMLSVREGLFAGSPGSVSFVAGETYDAPDLLPLTTLSTVGTPTVFNESGLLGWIARATGTDDLLYTGDAVTQILWQNADDPAPGLSPPGGYSISDEMYANDDGRVAFIGITDNFVLPTTQRFLLYAGTPDFPGIVAQTGMAAPDVPGAVYGASNIGFGYDKTRIANDDVIAFAVQLSGSTDGGVFLGTFGDIHMYAIDGMQAPDLPAGVLLDGLANTRIELNGNESVAFLARLTGPGVTGADNSAIFEGPPGDIRMLVREGDPAPGGGTLGDLYNVGRYLGYNDRRQVVFENTVSTGAGAWFGTTPAGLLAEYARTSTFFASDDGFVGTVGAGGWFGPDSQSSGSPEDGRSVHFNNAGQFITDLRFTGSTGSGIFVFTAEDPCFADCNGDSTLNVDDIDCFVAAFIGSDLSGADCDGNGTLNVDDIDCFVALFLTGCP